jgi:hypothetical protein
MTPFLQGYLGASMPPQNQMAAPPRPMGLLGPQPMQRVMPPSPPAMMPGQMPPMTPQNIGQLPQMNQPMGQPQPNIQQLLAQLYNRPGKF